VNNIIEVPKITKVPLASEYFIGVINLRGSVLPVIDTRIKLKLPSTEFTQLTCVLVLEIKRNGKIIQIGALVDSVQEVLEIEKEQILPPPKLGGLENSNEFIYGIVNMDEKLLMLLDINLLLNDTELSGIEKQVSKIKDNASEES
jgi:purine-binding chemotaxis protein CheW